MACYEGFDMAQPITVTEATAWWGTSPFTWMGYYLGGCCATTSWTGYISYSSLSQIGWGVRPIYVGQQVDDSYFGCGCSPLTNPISQAQSDANNAASLAKGAGFPAGAMIYLDIENVPGMSITNGSAIAQYINEWLYWITQGGNGYAGGIYTTGAYANQINSIGLNPVFWIACYPGGTYTCPTSCTCYNYPYSWQYKDKVSRTYNNVTLTIDLDNSDSTGTGGQSPGN